MIARISDMGSGFETAEVFTCLPLPHFTTRIKGARNMTSRPVKDLVGLKFNNLTPVEWIPSDGVHKGKWKCLCDCGNYTTVETADLNRGTIKSCGCMAREYIRTARLEDLSGQRFGRLVAECRIYDPTNSSYKWRCKCDCGNVSYVSASNLKRKIRSCGCYRAEIIRMPRAHKYPGEYTSKHVPVLYSMWIGMRSRCKSPSLPNYMNYGGRGIEVCPEWEDFGAFQTWAYSNGYKPGLTLDRTDNDGNYCPENCRWVDWYVQGNNRRTNVWYEYNEERHTLSEWSRIIGINRATLNYRISNGWSIEDALTKPVKNQTKKVKS